MSTYRPGRVTSFPEVARELEKVRDALERAFPHIIWDYLYAEPSKVTAGMLILADGTSWDPGEGAGFYRRSDDNASWVALEPTTVAAALAAHLADTVDAHDASAISNVAAGTIVATDVQAAINELDGDITAHLADTADAHDASAISILDTAGDFTATDVEGALAELQSDAEADATALADHIADTADAHAASAITNTPAGSIAATTVQAAIDELDAEKQQIDGTLTALSGQNWAANAIPIGTGADTLAQTAFAANTLPARASTGSLEAKSITDFGLSLVDDADAAAGRTTLGVVIGTDVQAYDADLQALADTAANGIYTRTGAGTSATRTITGTAAEITVTNGNGVSGNPTLSLPATIQVPGVLIAPNTGLRIEDTDASHELIIKPGSDLSADRILTITTGDAARTLTIDASTTLAGGTHSGTNTGDQTSVTGNAGTVTVAVEGTDTSCSILFGTATSGSLEPKTHANMTFNSSTGVVTFASAVLTTADINGGTADALTSLSVANVDASGFNMALSHNGVLSANRTVTVDVNDADRIVYLYGDLFVGNNAVLTNVNTGDQTSVTGNAGTVTVANEATDTTCFPLFGTAATGSLEPKTNTNLTFNSSTGVLTSASLVATTADINGGTVDGAVIGGASAAAATVTTLTTSDIAIVSVNSASTALRITQVGAGDALLVEDSANPDATPFVITNAGRVVNGHTEAITADGFIANQQQLGTAAISATQLIARFSANTAGSVLQLAKGRAATINAFDVVSSGDTIASIDFLAADSAALVPAAMIRSKVDGTPGTNDMPGRIEFLTTPDAAVAPIERFRIDNIGTIVRTQVAPANNNGAVTLTIAELKTGILTGTPTANRIWTLPTGTLVEGGFVGMLTNTGFEWSVISLAAFTYTIAAGTDHTVVGNMVVAANSQGRFLTRKTGTNTFVTYRIA